MEEFNTPDDWPDVEPESRGMSVDVMLMNLDTGEQLKGWFDFNTMCWSTDFGKVEGVSFTWRELNEAEKAQL